MGDAQFVISLRKEYERKSCFLTGNFESPNVKKNNFCPSGSLRNRSYRIPRRRKQIRGIKRQQPSETWNHERHLVETLGYGLQQHSKRHRLHTSLLSRSTQRKISAFFKQIYSNKIFQLKLELLNNCANIKENKLELDKYLVSFCGKDIDPEVAVYNKLPILIHSCPSNFSTVHYFEELQTNDIGRLVFYSNVLTSTQFVLSKKLKHGLVVIARQQTQGLGQL